MILELQDGLIKRLKVMIVKTLQSLDQFSKKPELRIFDKQSYSTALGQCTTISLMTIFFLIFGSSVYSIVNHTMPSVSINQEIVVDTSSYALHPNNFTLLITFVDDYNNHLVNISRYLQIELQNCLVTRSEFANKSIKTTQSCNSYKMQECQLNNNLSDYQRVFLEGRNLSGYYCINTTQWDDNPIRIQGTAQSNTFQYLYIVTSACKNSTNTHCETKEQINSYLNTFSYAYLIDGFLTCLSNYENPFQEYITTRTTKISIQSSKIIYHRFGIHEVQTDTGLILNEINSETRLGLSDITVETNAYNGEYIAAHMILIQEIKSTYSRSYQKLQTLFGQLGGLWQASISLIAIFIHPIARNLLYLKLSNRLYNLRTDTLGTNSEQNIDIKQAASLYLQSNQKSVKFKSGNVLKHICGMKTPLQLQAAHNRISQALDLHNILQKINEIDHLKQLLLTKEQYQLFDYLAKPSLDIDHQLYTIDTLAGIHIAYLKVDPGFTSKLDPNIVQVFQKLSSQGISSQVSLDNTQRPNARLNPRFHLEEVISLEEGAQVPR